MRGFRLAATAAIVMMCCVSGVRAQSRIAWVNDLGTARQMAQQQQRLLLLHFWSNSCPPCLRLERYVFNQPEVIRAIHSNYVPVKINATENPRVAAQFRVNRWPTDIIATVDGREVYRGVSQQDPNRYIAVLDQVAANTRVGFPVSGPASTAVAKTPTTAAPARGSTYPMEKSLAGNTDRAAGTSPARTESASRYSRPASAAVPQYTVNRYAGPKPPAAPTDTAARTAPMAPAYGSQFAPPAARNEGAPTAEFSPQGSAAGERQLAGPVAANSAPVSPRAPQRRDDGAVANAAGAPRSSTPQTVPANPPIGLEGYCPVTLVEQQKWVKGDPRWGAIHEGRTYLFAGPEQQKRFLAEFDKYAPALSGYDPVKFVTTGKLIDGKRAHGVFYRDQIYLFVDEASLQQFWTAPERYALAVLAARQQRGQNKMR